jgi:hypothetical protein
LPLRFIGLALPSFGPFGKLIVPAGDYQQMGARDKIMRGLSDLAQFTRSGAVFS